VGLVTFDGSGVLPGVGTAHIVLAAAGVVDTLLLMEFQGDNPREVVREGYDKSDGRSLTGSIKVKGNQYNPTKIWHCAFVVNRTQINLFESMLAAQRGGGQVALTDNWEGVGVAANVYLDVDDRYATSISAAWYLLQFVAREEV
jgi:hypothetical protein